MKIRRYLQKEGGGALIAVVMISAILMFLTAEFVSMLSQQISTMRNSLKDRKALAAAYAAFAEAFHLLKSGGVATFPYVRENIAFENGKMSYRISAEGVVERAGTPYITGTFTIRGIGEVEGRRRGIETRLERSSFLLKHSRFLQLGNLSYPPGSVVKGDVWVGGDVNLGGSSEFQGNVTTKGKILNKANGTFNKGVKENSPINLKTSANIILYRDLAQGLVVGEGSGLYLSPSSVIDFDLFDFSAATPKYNGVNLPSDFNGIIFVNGDATVKGNLEGRSLTVVSDDDIVIADNVYTGNTATSALSLNPHLTFVNASLDNLEQVQTVNINSLLSAQTNVLKLWISGDMVSGDKWKAVKMILKQDATAIREIEMNLAPAWTGSQRVLMGSLKLDPILYTYTVELRYKPNGIGTNEVWVDALTGNPVNIGLIAKDNVYIANTAPKNLSINAALLAGNGTWAALGTSAEHPDGYTPGEWKLTINGPIITKFVESEGVYSQGIRSYNYDDDIAQYPPPYFSFSLEKWYQVYWRELRKYEMG